MLRAGRQRGGLAGALLRLLPAAGAGVGSRVPAVAASGLGRLLSGDGGAVNQLGVVCDRAGFASQATDADAGPAPPIAADAGGSRAGSRSRRGGRSAAGAEFRQRWPEPASPAGAQWREAFRRFRWQLETRHVAPGDRIGVALSGGVDSTALAALAARWAASASPAAGAPPPPPPHALIVDHCLRPESTREALLTAERAKGLGLNPVILTVQWPAEGPPQGRYQEAARAARLLLLASACRQYGLRFLLTAHHFDDQVETFLLRLSRTSGLDGLAAIAPAAPLPERHRLAPAAAAPADGAALGSAGPDDGLSLGSLTPPPLSIEELLDLPAGSARRGDSGGWSGLNGSGGGISSSSSSSSRRGPMLLRPLLGFTKQELRELCEGAQLLWVEDASNALDGCLRNAMRHSLEARREVDAAGVDALGQDVHRLSRACAWLRAQSLHRSRRLLADAYVPEPPQRSPRRREGGHGGEGDGDEAGGRGRVPREELASPGKSADPAAGAPIEGPPVTLRLNRLLDAEPVDAARALGLLTQTLTGRTTGAKHAHCRAFLERAEAAGGQLRGAYSLGACVATPVAGTRGRLVHVKAIVQRKQPNDYPPGVRGRHRPAHNGNIARYLFPRRPFARSGLEGPGVAGGEAGLPQR